MARKFWRFINLTGTSAELLLYGEIASEQTWWGDEVTPKQFAEDLNGVGTVSEITVRINSGGGDVFAASEIGNMLADHPATVTAKIGGLCASAATVVACHCDKVIAANDSTYMVHPVKMGLFGYADAKTLQDYIGALATIRENIVTLYAKKTGREKDEVAAWMDNTSWWTGPQAKENGFVDELTDEEEDAIVENRNGVLFVNSVGMGVDFASAPAWLKRKGAMQTPPKDAGPEFVRNRVLNGPVPSGGGEKTEGRFVNRKPAGGPGKQEAQHMENKIETVEDLSAAYPALVDQIRQEAADKATNAERERIKGIDDATLPGGEALAAEAKYEKPMSASDFAMAMIQGAKAKGASFLKDMQDDTQDSGAEEINNSPTPESKGKLGDIRARAKADVESYMESKKGRR